MRIVCTKIGNVFLKLNIVERKEVSNIFVSKPLFII